MEYIKNIPLITFVLILSCISFNGCAQEKQKDEIKWMNWNDAMALSQKSPKKIFVDTYTDWCGWCKRMDASTFTDTAVAHYINKNYYAVKLNAENKDSLFYKDKKYG